MSDLSTSTAWQAYLPLATALARHLLGAAGAAGFTWALSVTASQTEMAVSAAMMAAAGIWSFYQKVRATRALRAAAVAPAGAAPPKLPA